MPLSRPVRREHIHSREIRCRGFRREDGLWDIEGLLEDTKTYSFANRDRDGIVAGEPIHRMLVRLTLDDALLVHGAEAATDASPFGLCDAITPVFDSLVGLRIGPGWRKAVLVKMAGVHGCTHLTDLLLGPVTTTAMQTIAAARSRRQDADTDGRPPPILDTCHALARTSNVVRDHWPAWHIRKT
ncbi:MAG: DUF2889 domain-containing protein [Defluviicoccus sp.]|nr:MAG: DUF2889 domain-containing protein [Defluviicoccus sp.]